MSTFGAWEDTVLEHTFDHVEYISLHTYLNNYDGDTPAFLASCDLMDSFIVSTEDLAKVENHPSWTHMYLMMMAAQVGFDAAYVW